MAEVFAGFVCGFIVAIVSAPLLAVALLRLRSPGGLLARLLPGETPLTGLVLALHGGLLLVWTAIGMVLGLILLGMEGAGGGLGSTNVAFTLLVFALVLAVAAPVAVLWRRMRLATVVAALAILGLFGWLMPYLAEWSRFDS